MSVLKRVVALCLLSLPQGLLADSGWQPLGNVSAVTNLPRGVELTVGQGRLRVLAFAPNVVRVHYSNRGSFLPEHSFAVLPNAFLQSPKVQVEQLQNGILISKDGKEGTDLIDEALRYNGTLPANATPEAPTQRSTKPAPAPAVDSKTRNAGTGPSAIKP